MSLTLGCNVGYGLLLFHRIRKGCFLFNLIQWEIVFHQNTDIRNSFIGTVLVVVGNVVYVRWVVDLAIMIGLPRPIMVIVILVIMYGGLFTAVNQPISLAFIAEITIVVMVDIAIQLATVVPVTRHPGTVCRGDRGCHPNCCTINWGSRHPD